MRRRGRRNASNRRSPSPKKTKGPRRMPNKLFVGNLTKNVSKVEMEREFGRYGRLKDVWISQKPAGFAFVEFLNSKDASECVQALDGRQILGSRLRVEFAKNEPDKQPAPPRRKSDRSRRRRGRSAARRAASPLLGTSSIATATLLPPPKSMLQRVFDRSSPSPLSLLRRTSALFDDRIDRYRDTRARSGSWEDGARLSRVQASLLLPTLSRRSRSPRGSGMSIGSPIADHNASIPSAARPPFCAVARILRMPRPYVACLAPTSGG